MESPRLWKQRHSGSAGSYSVTDSSITLAKAVKVADKTLESNRASFQVPINLSLAASR